MYKKHCKRLLDLIFALIALPLWSIILIVIGPLIYFQDKGPIFYNSSRLGKWGKVFKMYKFRSMKVNASDLRNADGSTYNAEDDPRLTQIGKFIRKTSLDETPQLLNIIKGDMSIIGPRPDLPEAIHMYNTEQITKLDVSPGLTGYSQAYYRNSIDMANKLDHDVYYVNNLSFILDLKIFFQTIKTIVVRKNIFNETNKLGGKENSKHDGKIKK